ncbi:MAG: 5-methyltetrahydropteroyltriglutamate--homocysteine S-methyltransferase [Eubacteriales bacterium]
MKTSVIGYPRVGAGRELKFATEKYWAGECGAEALEATAAALRARHWQAQREQGVDFIPAGDFSFYDGMLDTAVWLGVVPARYRRLGLSPLDEYFAMARGYQGERGDVKALAMKKWFHTNYHYLVPEIEDDMVPEAGASRLCDAFLEARELGIKTKPTVIGPFTFLQLARFTGQKTAWEVRAALARAYASLLAQLRALGAEWVQLEEPALVMDLSPEQIRLFEVLYGDILAAKGTLKVLLQTYFGDIRDCYREVTALPFDGIGLDFVEGKESAALIEQYGFPKQATLFAGVVNGKNVWRNRYADTLRLVARLQSYCPSLVLGTSCSLLHLPYTLQSEGRLPEAYKEHLAFAEEKLGELFELKTILSGKTPTAEEAKAHNDRLFQGERVRDNAAVRASLEALSPASFTRLPEGKVREGIQQAALGLPLLPTTTIGSFPQTAEVKANRTAYRQGQISAEQYHAFNRAKIAECIALQEDLGLDVLVHGEFERSDMVGYFGEKLEGFLFTERAWVQSYGTRCVKPPIIWGDIARTAPITVSDAVYAQSLTTKPVKGMLTGPVTILNWSFPREDISLRKCAFQLALAIRAEVLALEAGGIRIIQIDEAALREKLPLRKEDRQRDYLSWAIPAFRLVHSGVRPETQIHTHMCYSEFGDILPEIDAMDADVVSFEAARSEFELVETLAACGFRSQIGPGVYDIHSPRVPGVAEIRAALHRILKSIPPSKLWVNPDCGLKTRGYAETVPSLAHLVRAARETREHLSP